MLDCVIVGGGVIGLSLAYELSGYGWRTQVVDQGQPGRQTSWAGAGILPPANWAAAPDSYGKLCGLSHQLHPLWAADLLQQTGIDNGYRRCGGLHLARQPGEGAALDAAMQEARDSGIEVQQLTADALAELEPALALRGGRLPIRSAYLLPDEAQLRNPRHLKALLAACRQRGVQINGQMAVQRLRIAGSRVTALDSAAGQLVADRFCLTTGAWTGHLLAQIGLHADIRPWRGQIALLAGRPGLVRHVINEGPRYLVPRDDGRVLVGSTVEDVGFETSTTPRSIDELVRFAVQWVPELAGAGLEQSWAGLRPRTADGLPYLGSVPGLDNLWVAAGHFRSGLHLSPGTAQLMGQHMRGEEPAVDLQPFRLDRCS